MTKALRHLLLHSLLVGILSCPGISTPRNVHADSIEERYQESIQDLDRFRDNMDGRWFAVTMHRRYSPDGTSRVQDAQGVIYYSEPLIYLTYLRYFTEKSGQRRLMEHVEGIVTGTWAVSCVHRNGEPSVRYSEIPDPGSIPLIYSMRFYADITQEFERKVRDVATHEFAQPSIDRDGCMVVTHNRSRYMQDPDREYLQKQPVLEVIFAGDSDIRPVGVRLLQHNPGKKPEPFGIVDVRYALNSDGRPILQKIHTAARDEGRSDPTESYDIQAREAARPTWSAWPPRISLSSEPISAVQLDEDKRPGAAPLKLPTEVEALIRRISPAEYEQLRKNQRTNLESMHKFVTAATVSPAWAGSENVTVSAAQPDMARSPTVPIAVTGLLLGILGCWIILWLRANSRRS